VEQVRRICAVGPVRADAASNAAGRPVSSPSLSKRPEVYQPVSLSQGAQHARSVNTRPLLPYGLHSSRLDGLDNGSRVRF
jgi:hypothetical protein